MPSRRLICLLVASLLVVFIVFLLSTLLASIFCSPSHNYKMCPPRMRHKEKTQSIRGCLLETKRVMESLNLPYWVSDGTLLGAMRSEDIIPWDDDADIGMLQEDLEKLWRLSDEFSHPYRLVKVSQIHPVDKLWGAFLRHFPRKGVAKVLNVENGTYVDVFSFQVVNESDSVGTKIASPTTTREGDGKILKMNRPHLFAHRCSENSKTCDGANIQAYPMEMIFPLSRRAKIADTFFPIPFDAEGVMQYLYGSEWMTPDHVMVDGDYKPS